MFEPDTENVLSSIDIPIMDGTAVTTLPMSHSKARDTFRPVRAAHRAARTACLGSPTFGDNVHSSALRNRLIGEEVTQHRPTGIVNGFRHSCLCQPGRANVTDVYFGKLTRDPAGRNVSKMSALIGYLCRQSASARLLFSSLELAKLCLRLTVESWHFKLGAIRHGGERLEAQINPNGLTRSPGRSRKLNLNVDIPAPTRVSGYVPRLRLAVLRYLARKPQVVAALEEGQDASFKLRWAIKIGERNPVKAAFEGTKAWCIRETGIASYREFLAHGVNSIRVNAKFLGDATAQAGKIESGRSPDLHTSMVAALRHSVGFTQIVPQEVNSPSLSTQGAFSRGTSVLDSISVCEDYGVSRRHVYTRCWMVRGLKRINAYSPAFLDGFLQQVKKGAPSSPA
jgi:hypothetical protein